MSVQLLQFRIDETIANLAASGEARLTTTFGEENGADSVRHVYASNTFDSRQPEDLKLLLDLLAVSGDAERDYTLQWGDDRAVGRVLIYTATESCREKARRLADEGRPDYEDESTIDFVSSGSTFNERGGERITTAAWGVAA